MNNVYRITFADGKDDLLVEGGYEQALVQVRAYYPWADWHEEGGVTVVWRDAFERATGVPPVAGILPEPTPAPGVSR